MKSLSGHPVTTFVWQKGAGPRAAFELRGGGEVFATLAFLDQEGSLARVETAEGTWTLKDVGLMNLAVTLREEGEKVNLATFHPHVLRHGKLTFQDGAVFDWIWRREGLPGGAFLDPGGVPLVRLQASPGRDLHAPEGPEQCDVDLDPPASARFRHALLAAFGWFLILLDHRNARDRAAAETALRM